MEAIAGKVQLLRRRGLIEAAQNVADVVPQIRPYTAPVVEFKKPFEATVFEASNHWGTPQKNLLSTVKLYFTTWKRAELLRKRGDAELEGRSDRRRRTNRKSSKRVHDGEPIINFLNFLLSCSFH